MGRSFGAFDLLQLVLQRFMLLLFIIQLRLDSVDVRPERCGSLPGVGNFFPVSFQLVLGRSQFRFVFGVDSLKLVASDAQLRREQLAPLERYVQTGNVGTDPADGLLRCRQFLCVLVAQFFRDFQLL